MKSVLEQLGVVKLSNITVRRNPLNARA